jgi:hypothetical protein
MECAGLDVRQACYLAENFAPLAIRLVLHRNQKLADCLNCQFE